MHRARACCPQFIFSDQLKQSLRMPANCPQQQLSGLQQLSGTQPAARFKQQQRVNITPGQRHNSACS
jgi:hypothetical protein